MNSFFSKSIYYRQRGQTGQVHAMCPVAPTRDLEGSERLGLGVAYSSLNPFAHKWRGPLPYPPSMQTRGGACASGLHVAPVHVPPLHANRGGVQKGLSIPAPPIPVSPLHASRGWGPLLPSVHVAHCSCVTFFCDDTLNLP